VTHKGEYTAESGQCGVLPRGESALLGRSAIVTHVAPVPGYDDIPELKARGERLPLLRDPMCPTTCARRAAA